jgi:hypothetical protein
MYSLRFPGEMWSSSIFGKLSKACMIPSPVVHVRRWRLRTKLNGGRSLKRDRHGSSCSENDRIVVNFRSSNAGVRKAANKLRGETLMSSRFKLGSVIR